MPPRTSTWPPSPRSAGSARRNGAARSPRPGRALVATSAALPGRAPSGWPHSVSPLRESSRHPLGVRCALFLVFVGVGRSSGVNKIGRLFGGASPSGFAFGLRLRASPSGPPEATTRLRTHGRTPGVVPGFTHPRHTAVVFTAERRRAAFWSVSCCNARGRSRIHPPTARRGRICRGTPPCGVLERFLLHLLCFTSWNPRC